MGSADLPMGAVQPPRPSAESPMASAESPIGSAKPPEGRAVDSRNPMKHQDGKWAMLQELKSCPSAMAASEVADIGPLCNGHTGECADAETSKALRCGSRSATSVAAPELWAAVRRMSFSIVLLSTLLVARLSLPRRPHRANLGHNFSVYYAGTRWSGSRPLTPMGPVEPFMRSRLVCRPAM